MRIYLAGKIAGDPGYREKFQKAQERLERDGNAIATVQKLEEKGLECVEVKQHSSVLHPPTKLLREAILKREFFYEENRLLEINFQNARCTEDTNLNKYVNKKRSAGKVDMVMAVIDAVYLLQQDMLSNRTMDWVVQT